MAYYAALTSTIQLLDDLLHPNRYPNHPLAKIPTLISLHQKFVSLLDMLQDYSSRGDQAAHRVEMRIRDAAYRALDVIEPQLIIDRKMLKAAAANRVKSEQVPKKEAFRRFIRPNLRWFCCTTELQKVGREVNFIGGDLSSIGEEVNYIVQEFRAFREEDNFIGEGSRATQEEVNSIGGDSSTILEEVNSIVQELRAIQEEVNSIARELSEIQEMQACVDDASEQLQTGFRDVNTVVVGFAEQELVIKKQLCGSSTQLQVIPIVGMGGIGKTTLARTIFEDTFIKLQFDFRGWVTISQDYNVVRVLRQIVKSLGIRIPLEALMERDENKEERTLKDHIHKYLTGRKFLIVVDDVWDTEVWDDINHIFPNDRNGSRILLTTRLEDVAEYVGPAGSLHHMLLLDADASWTLLQKKAFAQEPCPLELVEVGKIIATKCQGLPLAIVVIGSVLSSNKTLGYWTNVAAQVGSGLIKDNEHLSNILSLSYNHLPDRLKPCFLYMGSFPEDYEIQISRLIQLWIAEGFLKSMSKFKSLEELGKEYLEDLVGRNLVIVTKKGANGEFKFCGLHDLLREFCKQRGLQESFFHLTNKEGELLTNGVKTVRRIILSESMPFRTQPLDNVKHIRSLCWFNALDFRHHVRNLVVDKVDLLRILDALNINLEGIPSETVSRMFHLKYLALQLDFTKSCAFSSSMYEHKIIEPLIISMSRFQNLETLIIRRSPYSKFRLISLPSEIWKMSQLKCLIIDVMIMPPIPGDTSLTKLEYLHTLETVQNFKFTDVVTEMIPNVRKLKIRCSAEYRHTEHTDFKYLWSVCCLSNLDNMIQLEKLNIEFDFYVCKTRSSLNSFSLPQNLKKLSLQGCKLPWEALTMVGSLKRLQVLRLRENAFVGQVWEPVEGEFLDLKFLLLEKLDFRHWLAEKTHFPKLERLKINECSRLEEIPLDIGEIDTLKFISVHYSKCARDSAKKILEAQQELGNYVLQVNVPHDYSI